MAGETRSVVVRLSMEASNYIREAQKAGKVGDDAMRRIERSASSADQAIDKIGNTAGKVALGGIATLLATGKAAVDWESQWAGVTKTVDGTTAQMAQLETGLRDLATTLPATHEEIAGVAEAAGQLGVAREDVVDFTKVMVDLGETTNLTAEGAATDIAQISNVMGTAGEDVDNLGSALVALGNDGASTEAQILGMAQRIAGAGALIGLAESDILGIANAAASMGIEVEAGGSAVSRVLTELAKASATGGEKLNDFSRVAGVSASEFARAFEEDPARAFASFTEGLNRINQSGGDVFTVLDQLGLSDVRVSQALLGMAASGDLLTDSLDLGAKAWEENLALTEEAEKRYATTASQGQVAWNKIKDAAIDAGDVILPVVADIADVVGDIADAFGALPAPVQKGAVIAVAALTGAGGLLWATTKVIGGVKSAKDTFDALPISVDKSSKAMKGLAAAGAGLAVLSVAAAGIRAIQDATDESLPGVQTLTGRLLDLSTTGSAGALGTELESLGASIDRLTAPGRADAISDTLQTPFEGLFGEASSLRQAKAEIEALDAALAGLVTSAGPEAAADAFTSLHESGLLTATQLRDLGNQLPQYQDAMAGVATESKIAAVEQGKAADGADKVGDAMGGAVQMTEEQAEALKKVREAGRETAETFVGLGDSLDDAEVSLTGWLDELEQNNRDLANFRKNARKASKEGLDEGLILSLHQAGEVGARRMRELAGATEKEIARANRAWRRQQDEIAATEAQAERLAGMSPVKLDFNADTGETISRIRIVQQHLDSIDRFIPVNIHVSRSGAGGDLPFVSGGTPRAQGGPIRGPGGPTDDLVPILASNGEYMIKAAAVEKYGVHMFNSINAMRFARGGLVGQGDASNDEILAVMQAAQAIRQIARDLNKDGKDRLRGRERAIAQQELKVARETLRDARKALGQEARDKAAEKLQKAADRQLDAAQEQKSAAETTLANAEKNRDTVLGAMADLSAATTAGFRTGLFDTQILPSERTGNLWPVGTPGERTIGGPLANLEQDIAGLEERLALQARLSGAGLTGDAFTAALSEGSNEDLSGVLARNEVGQMQALFNRRAELQGIVGGDAAGRRFGAELAAANDAVAGATQNVADATAAVARAEQFASRAADAAALSAQELATMAEAIKHARPITVNEAYRPRETAREVARKLAFQGA